MKTRILLETSDQPTRSLFKGSDLAYKIWSKTHILPPGARVEQILVTEHFKDLSAPPPAIEPVWSVDPLDHYGLRDGFRAITTQLPNNENVTVTKRKKVAEIYDEDID